VVKLQAITSIQSAIRAQRTDRHKETGAAREIRGGENYEHAGDGRNGRRVSRRTV
jgi:hypothetical protein